MKKELKYTLLTLGTIGVSAAIVSSTIAIIDKKRNIKVKETEQDFFDKNLFAQYDLNSALNQTDNIVDLGKKADINIFYSSYGIQPFFNLVRLAMLIPTETHFIYTKSIPFQSKINSEYFENYLKNEKSLPVVDSENQELISYINTINQANYNRSKVYALDEWNDTKAYEYCKKLVHLNGNKKINLYINSDLYKNEPRFATLTSEFPNLAVIGIEDSNVIAYHAINEWIPRVYDLYLNADGSPKDQNEFPTFLSRDSMYLVTNLFPNIASYFSPINYVEQLQTMHIKNVFAFFNNPADSHKEIKDLIFSQRDRNRKRLMTHWSKIIGLDWETERDIVKNDYELNQKESLIIIGTEFEKDQNLVTYLANKYADNYNIYYKGHPGKNVNATWITNNLSPSQIGKKVKFVNPHTNEETFYTVSENHIIRALETQISSEELTTYHVLNSEGTALLDNGLKFDKWILFDSGSGATRGINNGYNVPHDILEIIDPYLNGKENDLIDTTNSLYNQYIYKIVSNSIASQLINLTLTAEAETKNIDDLNLDDFVLNYNPNKLFFENVELKEIISKKIENNTAKIVIKGQFHPKVFRENVNNQVYEFELVFSKKLTAS
ncbi:hypothetical protein [Mycoplasmopsis gallinarum]|uniref:hypothetical protein n=1 Tax=Mycoplasmopsis gallinarum TaxID=29557 RepID=UPI000A625DE2|nr:hypothetical protein [Mycoplasmopsis gallinarum]